MLLFTGACAIQGIAYFVNIIYSISLSWGGIEDLRKNIMDVIAGDSSHGEGGYYSGSNYFVFFREGFFKLVICFCVAVILCLFISKFDVKSKVSMHFGMKVAHICLICFAVWLRISESSWIMKWIENEFQTSTYIDGKYWRYYMAE